MIGKKKTLVNNRASLLPFNQDEFQANEEALLESELAMDMSIIASPKPERKSMGVNRRRSSLGMSARTPLSESEQLRIANMYKLVIQMSSENKINDKNSWNYDLIDHMRNVIRDENKGVNFQKASCTLDASVKIYSHRVDDTYNASYRILENLSRNQHGNRSHANDEGENQEEDEGGENASNPKPKRAAAGRGRTYFANTLASSEEQFNAEKLENDENFDPMFQKITKSFDEGGAKGLLLYNLKLSSKNCSLLFDESLLPLNSSIEGSSGRLEGLRHNAFPAVNMKDLVNRSKLTSESIKDLQVCNTLKNFRATLKIAPLDNRLSLVNKLKDMQAPTIIQQTAPFSASLPLAAESNNNPADQSSFMDVDCWGDVDNDYVPPAHDESENVDEIIIPVNSMSGTEPLTDDIFPTAGKLKWTVNEEDREKVAAETENFSNQLSSLDKSSFDVALDTLDDGNAWAGASHWKYGRTRAKKLLLLAQEQKLAADSESVISSVPSETAPVKKTKTTTPKTGVGATFVLTPTYVDESKFGQPKKQDTTLLTQKALEKQSEEADNTILPVDQKLQVRDLARLFLLPNYLTAKNKSMLGPSSRSSSQKEKFMMLFDRFEGEDIILSSVALSSGVNETEVRVDVQANETEVPLSENYYDDDDGGGYYPETENTFAPSSDSLNQTNVILPPAKEGLEITEEKLIQCERKVAKIDVKYAKTSKKVNVHRLKSDIWSGIQETLVPTPTKQSKDVPSSESPASTLTFQNLINHVSEHQEQNEASLQYYFICLLHLANEKGLRIEGQEDLSDLQIRMDKA